jgi:2,4-dienoyl-CoA reductase-like NADH-dependent reductase (Old Yellow Enzyme family)
MLYSRAMTETSAPTISSPLTLPCGARLANRLVKAAMTEGLADADSRATPELARLYAIWSEGGAGTLLTGNVQVDRRYMERPGNVAIDGPQDETARARLAAWARAGTRAGNHLWMQISHAGRQTPITLSRQPVGPSDKPLALPGKQFGRPRALNEGEIEDIIRRFARVARVARETGFTGVQIHSAHGYLLSEFLSPDVNTRSDAWGGALENRARLLLETVRATRAAVGADFPISVKLNSADFQRGGFSHEDAITVARWLETEGVDALEISGGTYESPKMMTDDLSLDESRSEHLRASTIAREAYFLEYARDIRSATRLPLMVTGGFRSVAGMNAALASGATDLIGLGRPLCVDPGIAARLLDGSASECPAPEKTLRLGRLRWLGPESPFALIKLVNGMGAANWFMYQLLLLGRGGAPDTGMSLLRGFVGLQRSDRSAARRLRRPVDPSA